MFGRKPKPQPLEYDRDRWVPMLRCSICTGEQTAGLREKKTGAFREVMVIRSSADLEQFMAACGLEQPPEKFY